jgi:hypothetical protein
VRVSGDRLGCSTHPGANAGGMGLCRMVLMIDRMGTDIELHRPHQEDEREAERERECFDESAHDDDQQNNEQPHEKYNTLGEKSYETRQYPVKLRSLGWRGALPRYRLGFPDIFELFELIPIYFSVY